MEMLLNRIDTMIVVFFCTIMVGALQSYLGALAFNRFVPKRKQNEYNHYLIFYIIFSTVLSAIFIANMMM